MDFQGDRLELLEMINQIQSAQAIANLKEIVGDLMTTTTQFALSKEHQEVLDKRIDKYQSGQGNLFDWEEVLEDVRNK